MTKNRGLSRCKISLRSARTMLLTIIVLLLALLLPAGSRVPIDLDRPGIVAAMAEDTNIPADLWRRMESQAKSLTRGENVEEHFHELRTKIAQRGLMPVIVEIRAPFRPESELSSEVEINGQRAFINRIQNNIVTGLFGYDPASIKQYECIPYLALTVNSIGLEWLNSSPQILDISEDGLIEPAQTGTTRLIGAEASWTRGYTGAGQTIAVIDSGVDSHHPYLAGKVVAEACFSSNSSIYNSSSLCPGGVTSTTATDSALPCPTTIPQCAHGTMVAGIAAGRGPIFSGVAKDASIISIQAFSLLRGASSCGSGINECIGAFDSDFLLALEQVYQLQKFYSIAAVNLSAGGGRYSSSCDSSFKALKSMFDLLQGVDIATVVATGNNGFSNAVQVPACISTVISVGSTNGGTGQTEQISGFSNNSTLVKLLAPGEAINSSVPDGGFAVRSGTSMATPQVAGAFAIARQRSPNASVPTILSALSMTGVKITDSRTRITKPRIQIDAALDYLGTSVPPNPIPAHPTDLTATAASTSTVRLQWKDNSLNESGFMIRRRTDSDYTWSVIGQVSRGVTTFQHSSLRPGMTYYYSVIAFNPTGESEMSNEAMARTPDSGPAAPSRLTATISGISEVTLNWQDNSNEETGYRIYRSRGGGDGWSRVQTVGANLTSLRIGGLNPGMVYYFAVSTVNRTGESSLSNEVSAITGLLPPNAPSSLQVAPMSTSKITISWQDNSGNELGFRLRRRAGNSSSWSILADIAANSTGFDDTGLDPGTVYHYLVTSFNTAGESTLSREVWAETLINDGVSAPECPSELIAMATSNSSVELQWADNSTREMGFQIWKRTEEKSDWRLAGMVGADTTLYELEDLTPGETYSFMIRAYNGGGESVDSNKVAVMIPKMNFIPLGNNQVISRTIDQFESLYFRLYAPVGVRQLTIESSGDGNVDLYLRAENQPNRLIFNCRSMRSGSQERCTVTLPQAGNWHILAYGNSPLTSRFTISASYSMK